MELVGIIDEDFVNYKKPAMVLEFPKCNFKCDRECRLQVCQNSSLAYADKIEIDVIDLINRYLNNPITEAVVMQGLEPFDSPADLYTFISLLRNRKCYDDIVIYTGYNPEEIDINLKYLQACGQKNIIVKFGRFKPGQRSHYDEVLGVDLASDNQYAKKIC